MEQNPPPGLPSHTPDAPARPAVVPIRPGLVIPALRRPDGRQAPLPDPVAVRQIQVPDSLPPLDCTGDHGPGDPGPPATSPAAARSPAAGPAGTSGSTPPAGAGRLVGRAVPGPDGWPSQFAQVLAETLAGARPARQLSRWTTEQTQERIRQLGPVLASGQRPRLRRVMTSAPAAGVLEVTAVVGFGGRVRVLALRLERADAEPAQWQCTALESA
jgi:Family of unknown function (DUF6459)